MSSNTKVVCTVCGLAILLAVVVAPRLYGGRDASDRYSSILYSMDTVVSVETYGVDATAEVRSRVEELDALFDRHSEGTQLYTLDTEGFLENPSEYVVDLLTKTLELNREFGYGVDATSGALVDVWDVNSDSPTVPTDGEVLRAMATVGVENLSVSDGAITLSNGCVLDLGAVAKGYALDVVRGDLDGYGVESACVSMGSSTLLYGVEGCTVAVRSPSDGSSVACSFTVDGTSYVSTSGGYERYMEVDGVRYSHILDLSTGYPSTTDLTSVTVCADSGLESDFLSTYVYLGGTENLSQYLDRDDFKVVAIDDEGTIYASEGLDVTVEDASLSLSQ